MKIFFLSLISLFLFQSTVFAQILSTVPNCDSTSCFSKPSNIVLSSDGSFLVVLDSVSPQGPYLRKLKFNSNNFTDDTRIQLKQSQLVNPNFTTILSQDNKKVLVYRFGTQTENSTISSVDLASNLQTQIFPSSLNSGLNFGVPAFLDQEGKRIVARTLSTTNPELVIIGTEATDIQKKIPAPARVDSVNVSPDFSKTILTHATPLSKSISIYDNATDKINTVNIDQASSNIGAFQDKVKFDLFSNKAVVSSLSGNHVVHLLNLKTNKLQTKILDLKLSGPTLSAISADGMTIISAGDILSDPSGFQLYKTDVLPNGSLDLSQSVLFDDESIVLDLDITPDQSKVIVLLVKSGKKFIKIIEVNNLVNVVEVELSSDNALADLLIDPNGRYIVTPNVFASPSVNFISDLNLSPILKAINPTSAKTNTAAPFTVSSFIDFSRFSGDVKVCFNNQSTCASKINVSADGNSITGLTPSISEPGLYDVLLIAKSSSNGQLFESLYQDIFKFGGDITTSEGDSTPPIITVFAPQDGRAFNTRKVRILGRVDGTGSLVKDLTINGQKATLTSDSLGGKNVLKFSGDVIFNEDGIFNVAINAEDISGNKSESSIQVLIDTELPVIMATVTPSGSGFDVVGTVDGTGSNVFSILVNSNPVDFTQEENVDFTADVSAAPINISVIDVAGNKAELNISNPLLSDINPPSINIISPSNGDILNGDSNVNVSFTVADESSVKEVLFNGEEVLVSSSGAYSKNIQLDPGENLIVVEAVDSNGNQGSIEISVFYGLDSVENIDDDLPGDKEIIDLPDDITDLNSELIDKFNKLSENPEFGLSLIGSLEISNPPPIPDGSDAEVNLPETNGLDTGTEANEIPQGFSFASNINFSASDIVTLSQEIIDGQNTVILTDSSGRTFLIGFAILKEIINSFSGERHYKYQTVNGTPLELLTTINIPSDASIGDAKISVINGNQSLATINLRITESQEVKTGNNNVGKPQVKDPITATVKDSGKKLILKIPGENFIGKSAVIDGQLEKLLGKAKFFTNITFVPSDGIKIRKFQVKKKSITLTAEIKNDIQPGIKFFNVITPKGSDIGAITFPNPITDGGLDATTQTENLILETVSP